MVKLTWDKFFFEYSTPFLSCQFYSTAPCSYSCSPLNGYSIQIVTAPVNDKSQTHVKYKKVKCTLVQAVRPIGDVEI